ncbi:MAG: hypothetical protein ACYS7Y_35390 [Planctomycetota bacterium]|jgi:predicted SprT family Zn-dependent metalloprotease
MRSLIVLLLVMLSGCATTYQLVPPSHPKLQETFAVACELLALPECTTMEMPTVLFGDTGNALGYYVFGTRVVVISRECVGRLADKVACDSVVIHEMIHYILWQAGLFRDDPCKSEDVAWRLMNVWVKRENRRDLVVKNWRRMYPQCREQT